MDILAIMLAMAVTKIAAMVYYRLRDQPAFQTDLLTGV